MTDEQRAHAIHLADQAQAEGCAWVDILVKSTVRHWKENNCEAPSPYGCMLSMMQQAFADPADSYFALVGAIYLLAKMEMDKSSAST